MRRVAVRVALIGVLCLVLLLGLVGAALAGQATPVDIYRDDYGVPHIYSSTAQGLFFGYGYAAAQDRLFQLEISKRTALGRVAEVYGADYLSFDIATRRDGYTIEEIDAQIEALPAQYQEILQAFADGVNQYIEEAKADPTKMPKEFTDKGFGPTKWTSAEVIAPFIFTIGLQFMDGFAYGAELYNANLLSYLQDKYGDEQAAGMFDDVVWYEDPGAVATIPGSCGSAAALASQSELMAAKVIPTGINRLAAAVEAERSMVETTLAELGVATKSASNMVAISPDKSETGEALLMGGPQFWWTIPGFLMEVGLHGDGFDAVGTSPVGFPFIMFGHSDHHAWSSTYGVGNLVDNYILTVNPENKEQYWFNGAWKDMEKRTEVIKVKDAADSVNVFYRTVHGPVHRVVSDEQAIARRRAFEGEDLNTWVGYLESSRAANVAEFAAAASMAAYSMNWFYADKEGNIATYTLGRHPIRPSDIDDRLPTPGDGLHEWLGFYPFEDNPSCVNPDQGYLAQWNNIPEVGWRNGERQSSWGSADRVHAITDLLDPNPSVSFGDLEEIVRLIGLTDVSARYFKDYIYAAADGVIDPRIEEAIAYLQVWNDLREDVDDDGKYDSVGQTIFEKWLPTMLAATFQDEFGTFLGYGHPAANLTTASKMLYHALEGDASSLPPRADYFAPLSADAVILDSLVAALNALEDQFGPDMSEWKIGVRTLDFVPVNFQGVPQSFGAPYKIPYQNRGTQNHLVRLSEEGVAGVNINPPGQSGFIGPSGDVGPHYSDQLQLYADWQYKPMNFDADDIQENAESQETLNYFPGQVAFPDVPADHLFYQAIQQLAVWGIIEGYGNGLFGPNDTVKRAQMAKIIMLALGEHDEEITNLDNPTFADVVYTGEAYPFDYVEEAAEHGIIRGYVTGLFGPYDNLTRIQLIRIVVRAAGTALAEPSAGYDPGFIDIPTGDEALVSKAKFNGLIEGTTSTTLDPYAPATRGHVAQVVYKAMLVQ